MNDEAVVVALDRLRSGGFKVTTYRVFDGICEHQSSLVQVLRLEGRFFATFRPVVDSVEETVLAWQRDGAGGEPDEDRFLGMERQDRVLLLTDGNDGDAVLVASNSCCTREVPVAWLIERAESRTRRGIVPQP